jgi:hypothetical protein
MGVGIRTSSISTPKLVTLDTVLSAYVMLETLAPVAVAIVLMRSPFVLVKRITISPG